MTDTKEQIPQPRFWYFRSANLDFEPDQKIPKNDVIPAGKHCGIICAAYLHSDSLGLRVGFGFCSPLSNFTRFQGRRYAGGRFRKIPIYLEAPKGEHPKETIRKFLVHVIETKTLPTTVLDYSHPKAAKRFPIHFSWFTPFFKVPGFQKVEEQAQTA